MAGTPWSPYENPLLSGLFGSLQGAAAAHETTEQVWERLRESVGRWDFNTKGEGGQPTAGELQERGRQILSEQGVEARKVNEYRRVAGEWLSAKERLAAQAPDEQVTSRSIFRPPWAETSASGVEEQVRVRIQWQLTPTSGETFTRWSTYELEGPLTSVAAVETQAVESMEADRYLMLLSGGAPPTVESMELEQV